MDRNCYSPNRKKPLEKRSFTDCVCFFGFGAFISCWVMLALWAYQNSDQQNLLYPSDSKGQVCGFNKNVSDKPYLFFFDVTECASPMIFVHGCPTPQVCVDKCPETDWSVKEILDSKPQSQIDWQKIQKDLICKSPDLNKLVNSVEMLYNVTSSNLCAKYYIISLPLLNYCVPTLSDTDSLKTFMKNNKIVLSNVIDGTAMVEWLKDSKENTKLMADDLKNNYKFIIGGLVIAIVFSLTYILLLRWFSWIMIWLSLLFIVGLLGFGSYESYMRYVSFGDGDPPTSAADGDEPPLDLSNGGRQSWSKYVDAKLNTKTTWLWFTILSAVALVVLLLIIVFLRKRIRLSIALIVEGSRAILEIKSSLMYPLFQWLMYLAVLLWFLSIAVILSSMKLYLFKVKGLNDDPDCFCNGYYEEGDWCTESKWEQFCMSNRTRSVCKVAKCAYFRTLPQDVITGFQLFNVFGLFWLMNFVTAFSQMVLALTFASWYWKFHKKDVPFFTLTASVLKTIRYHLGTVAFGSLIIAVCNFIRAILEWVETKLKKYDNGFTRAVFTCFRCFFWLLNKFLRFVNRNAYIMCAMYGNNFCTSARQAFDLLLRNVLRVVVFDKVTDFIFIIGKIIITGATIAAFYFVFYEPLDFISHTFPFVDRPHALNYTWLPMIVVAAGAWVISSTFFHVFSVAVDTLFLCFLEDSERNDGSADHPYYMSKRLMNILGTRNVQSFPMR